MTVELSRAEDIAQVRRAVNALERKADGLVLEEIALSEDAAQRHQELRRALVRLGDPGRLRVGATTTRERARRASNGAYRSCADWRVTPSASPISAQDVPRSRSAMTAILNAASAPATRRVASPSPDHGSR